MGSAKTTFQFGTGEWGAAKVDALVVPVLSQKSDEEKNDDKVKLLVPAALKSLDSAMQGMILNTAEEEKFTGAAPSLLTLRKALADTLIPRRVILVGCGTKEKCNVMTFEQAIRSGFEQALKLEGLQSIAVVVPNYTGTSLSKGHVIGALVDAAYEATYVSLEAKEPGPILKKILLLQGKAATPEEKQLLKKVEAMAAARSRTKDLVNMPPNLKRTDTLVEAAQVLGKEKSGTMTTKVQRSIPWIEKNMPAFFSVARGSLAGDPPKFIQLHYRPKGRTKPKTRIALVGKSVIFDTGGYQVKTGNFMNTMKGDMTGGAVVVGAMEALVALAPKNLEVFAYMAATPNMIDSDAMVPDSIVSSTCGKKIEIRHTDAEGRLTLIDAVAKAAEQKPDVIVTIATLTGSASRAVGRAIALMGNDETYRKRVYDAAKATGDPVQTLDIFDEDTQNIKSKLDSADIINTTHSSNRGAQTAALFVMNGAPEGVPVVHLDIAGADMTADEKATGIGTKTIVQFLLDEEARLS